MWKVANTPVRSVGTVGGNVALASKHSEFPSDIALAFTAAGAMAMLVSPKSGRQFELSLGALLSRGIQDDLLLGFSLSIDAGASLSCLKVWINERLEV